MLRNAELYSEERDSMARQEGLVYVEDLALSGLMIALKARCEPIGLGKLHEQPVLPEDVVVLHAELVESLDAVRSKSKIYVAGGVSAGEINKDIIVSWDPFDKKPNVAVEYWDGRPVKAKLVGGKEINYELLTGFESFNPQRFDAIQGEGTAQKIIDGLRQSDCAVQKNVAITYIDPRESIPADQWDEGHEGPYMGFESKEEAARNGYFRGAGGILYFGWNDPGQYDF